MKFNYNKKYNTISIYAIVTFVICILITISLFKYQGLIHYAKNILSVLSPIIWGVIIAYILNPMFSCFEKIFNRYIFKSKKLKSISRFISIALTLAIAITAAYLLIVLIINQFKDGSNSEDSIFKKYPIYIKNVQNFIDNFLEDNPKLFDFANQQLEAINNYISNYISKLEPTINNFVTDFTKGLFTFVLAVKDFFLGIIVSVYIMSSKEKLIAQSKKMCFSILPNKTACNFLKIGHKANYTFSKFISGKALDSFIIGMISFIALNIMNMPYATLISLIIGITNMIPFFGPFIGAIPSAILVLLDKPDKVIIFVIFVIILQQFDGNILGPRILGDSTGLPAFWVLFAIFVGGGLFGFIGMILCVPVFAVIYSLVKDWAKERLKKKNLPEDTESYMGDITSFFEEHPVSEPQPLKKQENKTYEPRFIRKKQNK